MPAPNQSPDGEIFAQTAYEAPRPDKREFHPWHRPRKHFVRERHWTRAAARLFASEPLDRPLRYLGLPGPDLLDIRHFHSALCGAGERPLLFLGFNRAAQAVTSSGIQLNSSLDEVRRLANVDERSDVIPDDFRSLARKGSPGYKSALEMAPFDVINIDLCDGLLRDEPAGVATDHTMYDAIAQAVAFQQRNERPWVLMLTSRIGVDHEDPEVVRLLSESFARNLDNCDGFQDTCEEFLGDALPTDVAAMDPTGRFRLVSAYICKWLLHLLVDSNSGAEVASSGHYHIQKFEDAPDLLSLVVRVYPQDRVVSDRFGLARATPELDECAMARAMVGRLNNMVDIDGVLAEDRDVWDVTVDESAMLLASAHYDPAEYRAWVEADRPADPPG